MVLVQTGYEASLYGLHFPNGTQVHSFLSTVYERVSLLKLIHLQIQTHCTSRT